MNKQILRLSLMVLGFTVFFSAFSFFFRSSLSKAAGNNSNFVNVADLQTAGFTQVKQIAPTSAGRFTGPELYFQVSDKVTVPTSEAPNVVMVYDFVASYQLGNGALFNYGPDDHDYNISGGSGKEATLFDGKVAINFVKNNHYDVIIGPNKAHVEALAQIMAAKF